MSDNSPEYTASYKRHTMTGSYWAKIGVGFVGKKGISVSLDALPVGEWDGTFMLFPNKEKSKSKPKRQPQRRPIGEYLPDEEF